METDLFISRRLGGKDGSSQLKVRYWRTRQHLPKNREQCILLGKALDFLILALLERYERECAQADVIQRQQWLYIHCQALDKVLQRMDQQSLRFLYFRGLHNFLQ